MMERLELYDRDKASPELKSVYRKVNLLLDELGTEKTELVLEKISLSLKLDESDPPRRLKVGELERALKREQAIKEHNHRYKSGGRPSKVQKYFDFFKKSYERNKLKDTIMQVYLARKELSRTSFWRFRKKVKEEFGFDPIDEFADELILKETHEWEKLGSEKS